VTTDLSALASMMPTQRPVTPLAASQLCPRKEEKTGAQSVVREAEASCKTGNRPFKFSLSYEKASDADSQMAADADMTECERLYGRLSRQQGMSVRDEDLADLRTEAPLTTYESWLHRNRPAMVLPCRSEAISPTQPRRLVHGAISGRSVGTVARWR